MAYFIHRTEAAAAALQNVLLEQNQQALELLESWRDDPARNIHGARQRFKRIRAALRLLRPVAPYVFSVENQLYRALGRQLSHVRDASAMVEAIDFLHTMSRGEDVQESLGMLKIGLEHRAAAELESGLIDLPGRCEAICAELERAGTRFTRLPLRSVNRQHLKQAARKGLRRCAKFYNRAYQSNRAEDFHECRKQVKYSYNQARLMQDMMPRWARRYAAPLDQLAGLLGHRQDFFVLDQLLVAQPDELGFDMHLRRIRMLIDSAQDALQGQIFAVGNQISQLRALPSPDNLVTLKRRAAGHRP